MRRSEPRLIAAALSSLSIFATGPVQPVSPDVIQNRFARLHSKNDERAAEIQRLFAEAGCAVVHQKIQSSPLPNVLCRLPGESTRTVVVGAHYDNRGPGEGAIDNWSGASLLPSLFEALKAQQRRLSFVFLAFTYEEKGLIGSRDYVQHLGKEERESIAADVNIDSVGMHGPIRAWAERSNNRLLSMAAVAADESGTGMSAEWKC